MKSILLCFIFFSFLFTSCKKFSEAPQRQCSIPYVDFVAQQVNTSTLEVNFTASVQANGTISSYQWDFGDGTSYSGPNPPTHQYPAPPNPGGSVTYKVKYSVTNECGTAYWSKDIVIAGCLPDAKFSTSKLNDSTVQFTNLTVSNGATNFVWNFGDGTSSTSSANTLTHVYSQDQSFTASLKATNSCGENNFTQSINICREPIPSQTVTVSNCGAVNINASATRNGGRYQWNFGNGTILPATPSATPTISYTYPNSGTYTITLTVYNSNSCDTATTANTVTVNAAALGTNNNWTYTSDDLDFNFSRQAVTNATSYTWDFGDNTTSNAQNPGNKSYLNPGTYTLTLGASNSCGSVYSFSAPLNVPYYKAVNNIPATGFQQVIAIAPSQIYFLGTNGRLYKTDTAGNWSSAINLPAALNFGSETRLFKDQNNNLWIYGRKEVAKFNSSSSSWTSYFSSTGFSNNTTINSMVVDNNNVLWTIGDGKLRKGNQSINGGSLSFTSLAYSPGSGRIWLTSSLSNAIYYVVFNATQLISVALSGLSGGGDDIVVHPNGEIWFTTSTGIIRTNNSGLLLNNYNASNTGGQLSGRPTVFDFDEKGNLWFLLSNHLHKMPLTNTSNTKDYSFSTDLNNLSWMDVFLISGNDTDIITTKTTGNAAIKIR